MDKLTIILNDPPYGTEKIYNGLRYASALVSAGVQLNLFLLADGQGAQTRRMLDLARWTKESDSVLMF